MSDFRTKRGRCIIDDEALFLSSSWSGQFRRALEGGALGKIWLISVTLLPVMLFLSVGQSGLVHVLMGAGIGALLLMISLVVNRLRGFGYDRKILRDDIESFTLVEGSKGLTNPRFILKYRKDGKIRKRYISLPSKLFGYVDEEVEKAREVLESEGFQLED